MHIKFYTQGNEDVLVAKRNDRQCLGELKKKVDEIKKMLDVGYIEKMLDEKQENVG